MNAIGATFAGPHAPLDLVEIPIPAVLNEGEVLVHIELAAICGSDLHTLAGTRPERIGTTMGHEGVGRVVMSARESVSVGERITWSLVDICGTCASCNTHDLPQKCVNLRKYGHGRPGLTGTFATHIVLEKGTMIQTLSEKLHPHLAATANCALGTASQLATDLPKPERAIVLGAGLLGLYCAHLLEREEWKVEVVDGSELRRSLASQAGFKAVLSPSDQAGLIVEVAGSADFLQSSYPYLRPGGELRLAGLVHPESQLGLTAEDIIRRCWTVRGSHNYHPIQLVKAGEFAMSFRSRFPTPFELGPVFSLVDINEAIRRPRLENTCAFL